MIEIVVQLWVAAPAHSPLPHATCNMQWKLNTIEFLRFQCHLLYVLRGLIANANAAGGQLKVDTRRVAWLIAATSCRGSSYNNSPAHDEPVEPGKKEAARLDREKRVQLNSKAMIRCVCIPQLSQIWVDLIKVTRDKRKLKWKNNTQNQIETSWATPKRATTNKQQKKKTLTFNWIDTHPHTNTNFPSYNC